MTTSRKIRRALLSVSDKAGVVELARALAGHGVELVSTGGTAAALKAAGLAVLDVAELTGFPEMMDGRVKTLHPRVHGGLLGVRGNAEHDAAAREHGIAPIDLLVVNLYPFVETVAKGADYDTCVENIDIGGPAMLRAAAKNHAGVTVVVEATDYARVLDEMQANGGGTSFALRRELAFKAYAHTAAYDGAISNWLGAVIDNPEAKPAGFPRAFSVQFNKQQELRYGENPHQQAAFYVSREAKEASIATARQLQGKELSYNNIADSDAALECVKAFAERPTCVIVKHANPCGVAEADSLTAAYDRAYKTDPESAFGGIIAFNRKLDAATTKLILDRQFVEVLIAPEFDDAALAYCTKKANVRVLRIAHGDGRNNFDVKRVGSGLLMQTSDNRDVTRAELKTVSKRQPSEAALNALLFAWRVAKLSLPSATRS